MGYAPGHLASVGHSFPVEKKTSDLTQSNREILPCNIVPKGFRM